LRKEEAMMKALSRGHVLLITLACLTCLAATGCRGLTDLQLSSILQTTVTTALTTVVSAIISAATGVTVF
jgi:hypothetical protein